MNPNRFIQLTSLVCAAVCISGAALLGGPIHLQRERLKLSGTPAGHKGVPPGIMLAQASLGSFRGLAVDFLWHRANKLKEAGQYREANQLSQWICMLQPRFESVWVFHAWNMAYNISVATHTQEERWNWVNKGIRLLREDGLPANPESVLLNKELSWIFFHKVGGVSDDMHWYYRKKLAAEWQEVLGSPEGLTTEQMIQRIKDIADAPDVLEELLEDEKTRLLLAQLRRLGYEPDERLMRQFGRIFMVEGSYDNFQIIGLKIERAAALLDIDLNLYQFMSGSQQQEFTDGYRRLVHYLRKKVLQESYRMDPAEMVRMMTEYGPMDWRHPVAHGAYWAEQGINAAARARVKTTIDQINTDRLIIHSMQEFLRSGRLSFDPVSGYLDMLPDPRFVKSYEKALGFAKDRIKGGEYDQGTMDSYNSGYENFLLQAITYCYNYGARKQAEEYWQRWRDEFRTKDHNANRRDLTLERLVWQYMEENLGPMRSNTRQFIDAQLRNAFLKGWGQGQNNLFRINYKYAKTRYDQHQEKYGQEYNANAESARLRLPPWPDLFLNTYITVLKDRRIHLIARARIWRATPPRYRVAVYDALREGLRSEALAFGLNPERVLPEPKGMEEYRRVAEQRRKKAESNPKPSSVERQ